MTRTPAPSDDRLAEAVAEAAATFRFYEQNHRDKVARFRDRDEPDEELIADTLAKAERNREMAEKLEAPADVAETIKRLRFALRDWDGRSRSHFPELNALTLDEAADLITRLSAEIAEAREVLERCATIVERNLYHQHEKIEDVPKIARAFLARQETNDADG